MALPVDGQTVSYVGASRSGMPAEGDIGVVVAAGNKASHIKMTSGRMNGQFLEIAHTALSILEDQSEDLFGEPVIGFSIQSSYDMGGPDAVINRLNHDGHLSGFEAIAEEALAFVSQRIRSEPAIQEAVSALDSESGDDLISAASFRLLSDAFGRRSS